MSKSTKKNIPDSSTEFLEFFKTEVERIENEIKRVTNMQEKLSQFTSRYEDSVTTRGAAHYYIESIKNELQASSQKQSLIRDMRDLRKMALDYSIKMTGDEGDGSVAAMQKKMMELVAMMRIADKSAAQAIEDDDVDAAIERRLNENK